MSEARERVRRFVRGVVVFVVGFGCGAIWLSSKDLDPLSKVPGFGKVSHEQPAIERNPVGLFGGTIELTNSGDDDATVLVTVTAYEDGKGVAELMAKATVPGDDTERVTLRSTDRWASYEKTKVRVVPIPLG